MCEATIENGYCVICRGQRFSLDVRWENNNHLVGEDAYLDLVSIVCEQSSIECGDAIVVVSADCWSMSG